MKRVFLFAVLIGLFFVWVTEAVAITAWSRKYSADCSMCHWKQNKLNATGKDFLKRGHRMPGEDSRKDSAWNNLSDYISITEKIRSQYDSTASNRPGTFVEALSLYAGGPIDKKFSFFYEQYMHENNKAGADREKLAEAYLMYTSSDSPTYLTFRIGQIAPYLLHYHGTGGRLPISRPYVLESSSFAANNPYAPRARQYGVEIAHNHANLDVYSALGIVNGTGHKNINPAGDTNTAKDLYLTVEKNFDGNGSSLGFYGYSGKWSLDAADAAALGIANTYLSVQDTNFYQIGVIGNYTNQLASVVGGVLSGNNSQTGGASTNNLGYYLEGDIALAEKIGAYTRYDMWDGNTAAANDEAKQAVVGLSIQPMESGRIAAEGQVTKVGNAAATQKVLIEIQYMY